MLKRQKAYRWGRWAEYWACLSLILKGYVPVAHNYRTPYGEIDLILCKKKTLVFVEVKARRDLMAGLSAVSLHQQRRICQAAKSFLAIHPVYGRDEIRFDVVAVRPWRWPRHVVQAWNES